MKNKDSVLHKDSLEFAIFCIENLAIKLSCEPKELYKTLVDNNILFSYIIPEYEILHTQSKEYILDDIIDVMNEKGVAI